MKRVLKSDLQNMACHVITTGTKILWDLLEQCRGFEGDDSLSREQKDSAIKTISSVMLQHLVVIGPVLPIACKLFPEGKSLIEWCDNALKTVLSELDPCTCKGCVPIKPVIQGS